MQKRFYEVTRRQIWVALIIVSFVLAIVFELGIWIGERRVIDAEREAAWRNNVNIEMRATNKSPPPAEEKLPDRSPIDQPTEGSEVERKEIQYTVQVGTFSSRQNAENLVTLLESYDYKSWLKPGSITEKTVYCVFVGTLNTKNEAEEFGRLLKKKLSQIADYRIKKIQEND